MTASSSNIVAPQLLQCEKFIDDVVAEVNTVQYLMWTINEIGGRMDRSMIKCIESDAARNDGSVASSAVQAGYLWGPSGKSLKKGEIALRADKITSKELAERNLRHELIHAFDDARGFVDPQDCLHHACSEIRAARLSGDCLGYEVAQNWSDPMSSGLQCVRRRAVVAVDSNPVCRSFAERAVEKMFPKCYGDNEPFVAPIYGMGNYGYQSLNMTTGELEGGYFQRWKDMKHKKPL